MSGSNGLVKSYEKYVGDFETTTDPNDCRVWLWAVIDITTLEIKNGLDIQSYCKFISQQNSYIWFHNLAFDGSFIIDFLMKHEYEFTTNEPIRGQFTTTISNMGKFYAIKIIWNNGHKTEIRDSLKKLPMSAGVVAESFKLDESKGKIDYDKIRPVGYIPTLEELEYVNTDVTIIARALRNQISIGLTRLTVGSDALAEYKELIGRTMFNKLFPVLPMEIDREIRKAYRGGFTYSDPRFSKRIIKSGKVFDVNSLYPFIMYTKLLPAGEPLFQTGIPIASVEYPLWISSMTITAKIKKNHIPCIQIKGHSSYSATEYQTIIDEPTTITCSNVDWRLWNKHYHIDVLDYNGIYYFQGQNGLFDSYVDKWSKIKAESTGGIKTIAKLMLNSLYGKFGTNPNVTPKIPFLDDNTVRLKLGNEETRDPVYTAMAVFITAYARELTISAAQDNYKRFLYADTDSLHLSGDEYVDLEIHPNKLGAWKHEYDFVSAYYQRAKAYSERKIEGYYKNELDEFYVTEMETHIAGLPKEAAKDVQYHHYITGAKFGGKLSPTRVPGGIVLTDIGFTLSK